MKKITIFIFVIIVFSSCLEVWICRDNTKNFKKSLSYKNQIPLTVAELKDLIYADTTRYKVVFFFSPCCGFVPTAMKNVFIPFYEQCDTNKVNVIFLSSSYGNVKYNEKFFEKLNFKPDKIYYVRDSLYKEAFDKNIEGWEKENYQNILNYIFSPKDDPITSIGTPMTFIVSKDNQLKRAIYNYKDKKGKEYKETEPFYLGDLKSYDLDEIDFSVVDEVYFLY